MLDEAASRLCVVRGHGALADAGLANGVKRGFELNIAASKSVGDFYSPSLDFIIDFQFIDLI